MGSSSKWVLLAALYFSQGLPYGFFTQALPAIMRQQGASLTLIGASSLLVLPWACKFMWAPLVDRYGSRRIGRRKSWIFTLQFGAMFVFVALAFTDSHGHYGILMIGFLIANAIAATQDIATDGFAVVLLRPQERGMGNGLQVAGYRTGMIAGGGFILTMLPYLSIKGAFLAIALMVGMTMLPMFGVAEPVNEEPPPENLIGGGLKRQGFVPWLLVIGFYKFGDAIGSSMLRPFLVDQGLGLVELGSILGTAGFTAGLLGAVAGGLCVNHLGRFRSVWLLGVLQAAAVGFYAVLSSGILSMNALIPICVLEHFTGGMATVAIFTVMMDACKEPTASTDYTLQASFVVIATLLSSVVAGVVAQIFGFTVLFLLSGALSLVGAWVFASSYNYFPWSNTSL